MNNLKKMMTSLEKQMTLHGNMIYNYAIPEAWNVYGFHAERILHSKEIIVNPFQFYAYTIANIFKDNKGNVKAPEAFSPPKTDETPTWIRHASIYSCMIRPLTSWDHDRDEHIDTDNLYHLSDQGTFLKTIALLPLIRRLGINTILLEQSFMTGSTSYAHTFPKKEAVYDFRQMNPQLADSLIPDMNANEQCAAFVEACHSLGLRVILEYFPGKLARDNAYLATHPEWFYWIDKQHAGVYQAPVCHALPQNTIPYSYTLRDLYRSRQVQEHISVFKDAPTADQDATLADYIHKEGKTTAPFISDQINANIPADVDTTAFRFFQDKHEHVPAEFQQNPPYITQDSLRCDLYPGKEPMQELWDMLSDHIIWYQDFLGIDGVYLKGAYLLPEALQIQLADTAHKHHSCFAMIIDDTIEENTKLWSMKGYDAQSGNSGYVETDIWNYKFHDVAYQLRGHELPLFAACEFTDGKRVCANEHGQQLAMTLTVMNHFIPNGIPFILNGIECAETQPLQLSEYGNMESLETLAMDDVRHHRQAYLDTYFYNYRSPFLHTFPNILSKISSIRKEYITAIVDEIKCIPVWFDNPKDFAVGYTYILEHQAMMVVANINVHSETQIHIHTDNLLGELPGYFKTIRQVYSTSSPYTYDVEIDEAQAISLPFTPGEVKFIELQY